MTQTSTPPTTGRDGGPVPQSLLRQLIGRITRLEIVVGGAIAALMALLVLIEPDILEAPFENAQTLVFTFGGTALAAVAFAVMLWLRVPPAVRLIVLVVPFAVVNWWLISPYFIDDTVDEEFSTSISQQLGADETPAAPAPAEGEDDSASDPGQAESDTPPTTMPESDTEEPPTPVEEPPPAEPSGPVLLGAGQFVGLAGHDGTGDAGLFQNPDGSLILRFENFDIENGPDLEVYLVPGADQTSLPEGSIHLGALKGNIGDQNYELPAGTDLGAGAWTALVWCEAFSVEFVGATITI